MLSNIEIKAVSTDDDVPLVNHWTYFRLPANPNDRCRYKDDCYSNKNYTCMPDPTFKGREVIGCYKTDAVSG